TASPSCGPAPVMRRLLSFVAPPWRSAALPALSPPPRRPTTPPGRLVAGPDIAPCRHDDHALDLLRTPPGIQRHGVATATANGIGDPGPTQRPQGRRIAAAFL